MLSQLDAFKLANPGLSDAEHVAAIAHQLIETYDLKPPVSLDLVAALRDVNTVERVFDLDCPGCLVPGPDGWAIKLRATDTIGRQNFTGFHEVGHTFFNGFELQPHYRCSPQRHTADPASVEALCDIAAAELLFPREHFAGDLQLSSFGHDAVEDLATKYMGSREATAIRLVDLWPEPAFLLRLSVCNKPSDKRGATPVLRASAFVPGHGDRGPIRHWKSLDRRDPLTAIETDDRFRGISSLLGLQPNAALRFEVDALRSEWLDPITGELKHRVLVLARRLPFPR